jgi:mono/diheme cytochrome c family protein
VNDVLGALTPVRNRQRRAAAPAPRGANTVVLTTLIGAALVGVLATSGCDTDHGTPVSIEGVVARGIGLPPVGGRIPGEVHITPETVARGQAVFNERCTSCHGPGATGRIGLGPALASKSFLEAADDKMLLTTIGNGRAGTTMVPWKTTLRSDDIANVVAYIRSTVPHERVELNEAPLDGEPSMGEDLYRSICAKCHGASGAGYSESSSGTGIGRYAFLSTASNGYIRHIAKHGKTGTKMRPFDSGAPTAVANLNDSEIDSVIAYLRQRAW